MESRNVKVTFDPIIGHDRVIRVLRAGIRNNRVAHAYLFAGPDGVGKRTTAYAFAAALNCEQGNDQACGQCNPCHKIIEGIHPDVSMVERDGNFIKIEQVRDISRQINYAPYEGRRRVILFQDAERMNESAANALLKTLEEPRPNNVLILLTASPQQLLPTILSRCQRVNFNPLPADEIERHILQEIESDPVAARLLARLSGGSLGWVMQTDVNTVIDRRKELLARLSTLDPMDETAIAEFADTLMDASADLDTTFELLKTFLRDAAVVAGGSGEDRVINIDIIDKIKHYAAPFSPERILAMGRSVGYAQRLLVRNVNKNLIAMSLALELVHPTGAGFDAKRMPR